MDKFKVRFILDCLKKAREVAKDSSAEKLQVGCVIAIAEAELVLVNGRNGTPPGWDNKCEEKQPDGSLKTKPEVIHAESNAITKLAKLGKSAEGTIIVTTHQPCIDCAKLIFQAGIKEVYYDLPYSKPEGMEFLKKAGVAVYDISTIALFYTQGTEEVTLKYPATVKIDGNNICIDLVCPNGKVWGTSIGLGLGARDYLIERIKAFNNIPEQDLE